MTDKQESTISRVQGTWEAAFLEYLRTIPNISAACRAIGIDRTTPYNRSSHDPDFKQAMKDAIEDGVENLEAKALERAVHGTSEPIYQQGKLVGEKMIWHDSLHIALLKAHKREFYSNKVEMDVNIDVTKLSDDELAKLAKP